MPPLLPHTTHTNTHTQVRAVADRFIYDQDIAIAAVGDVQFLPDYSWFRRRTYWIRY
jgi:processing peptidase subunit beta